MPRCFASLALCLALPASALFAAPPAVTTLFPAGAQRGTTVEVKPGGGAVGTPPVSVWCSQPGFTFEWNEKNTALQITVPEQVEPGTVWLRFHNSEGASSLRPFLIGQQPEIQEKEPNNEPAKATPTEGPAVVINAGLIASADVDVFSIPAKKGQTLVAAVEANRIIGSPMDAVLQILSPAGDVLEQNDDYYGLDPLVTAEIPEDGTYYVRVFAFPAVPNSSVRFASGDNFIYRLTLATEGFATHCLPLAVQRGVKHSATLAGWNLRPVAAALEVSAANDQNQLTIAQPELANAVSVRAVDHLATVEQEPNDRTQPQAMTVPGCVSGVISEPGDVDVYRIEAKKGDRIVCRAEARTFGSALDPVIRFLNADGTLIRENDDLVRNMYEAELEQVIPADGTYLVEVLDLYGHGGFDYPYLLTLCPPIADFELTLATENFTFTPGKPLEIPVTVNRLYRHADAIEIVAEGLPDGLTAQPAISEGKGATAKSVKLKIEGDSATPFSGPIRIVGRSQPADADKAAEGQTAQERVARGTISGLTDSTEHIWLTVVPAKKPAETEQAEKAEKKN